MIPPPPIHPSILFFLSPSRLRFRVQFTCPLLFHCPCHDGLLYSTILLHRCTHWCHHLDALQPMVSIWELTYLIHSDSRSPRVLRSDSRCWLSECGTWKATRITVQKYRRDGAYGCKWKSSLEGRDILVIRFDILRSVLLCWSYIERSRLQERRARVV